MAELPGILFRLDARTLEMNADDPKLTAFALNALHEPEKSEIAREVADSPEAQHAVNQIRELAGALKSEFASELKGDVQPRRAWINIEDDPWFWSRARPLAIAAVIAIFALFSAIVVGTYKSLHDSSGGAATRVEYADVEGEEKPHSGPPDSPGLNNVHNPLRRDVIGRIERVVVGEVRGDPQSNGGEVQVIEMISDSFRVQRLKNRLTTPTLSKKAPSGAAPTTYQLMFLDRGGHILAAASFYHVNGIGFVLQPSNRGYDHGGRYFTGGENAVLPGDWESNVSYQEFVIPFPDWTECIGYAPGV